MTGQQHFLLWLPMPPLVFVRGGIPLCGRLARPAHQPVLRFRYGTTQPVLFILRPAPLRGAQASLRAECLHLPGLHPCLRGYRGQPTGTGQASAPVVPTLAGRGLALAGQGCQGTLTNLYESGLSRPLHARYAKRCLPTSWGTRGYHDLVRHSTSNGDASGRYFLLKSSGRVQSYVPVNHSSYNA